MQDSLSNPPQWLQFVLTAVASVLGGVGIDRLFNTWLNRKKPIAEVHLTQENAAEVRVRSHSAAGDAVMRMMTRLEEAQANIDRLRQERDAWQDEYDKEFTQRKTLAMRVDLLVIEADSLKDQMEGAYAYIKFLGRHPTDVDKFRVQLKEGEKGRE